MKTEALKLADELEALHQYVPSEAPAMIRRLVEELDKQGEPVAWMLTLPDGTHDWILDGNGCEGYIPLYTAPQTKPLSDEEITYQFQHKCPRFSRLDIFKYAVKWAEERHGIK